MQLCRLLSVKTLWCKLTGQMSSSGLFVGISAELALKTGLINPGSLVTLRMSPAVEAGLMNSPEAPELYETSFRTGFSRQTRHFSEQSFRQRRRCHLRRSRNRWKCFRRSHTEESGRDWTCCSGRDKPSG